MSPEATIIVIDSLEYMRNGDYPANRYEAQLDAVDIIFNAKRQANAENSVGVILNGGSGPVVLSTLTSDIGRIRSGIHELRIYGNAHFADGVQVAALALKHRQNKVQTQRIIMFVGSPITEAERDLERLAKRMKKNSVAIDIISFGEHQANAGKLEKFMAAVDNNGNSHLLTVPVGPKVLSAAVVSLPILSGEEAGGEGDFGGDGFDFDMNADPDLALALRLSLEEEKAKQKEREEKAKEQS